MKKVILLLFIFISFKSFSQGKILHRYDYAISPELIYEKQFLGGLNLTLGTIVINKMMVGMSGTRIGMESNFKSGSDFIIAPKIGYEITATFLTFRLTGINYFQNGNSEFRILPEIGISAGGFINLTYGYNLRITNSQINGIGNNRICLSINLNKKLRKEVFP